MKIPLKVEEAAGGLKPFAYFSIKAPHCFGHIRAFVDTGSPDTMIGSSDRTKLKLPYVTASPKTCYGAGGGAITLHEARIDYFNFKDSEGKPIKIKPKSAYISQSNRRDNKTQKLVQGTPSILGVDFLLENGFCLYFDPNKKKCIS